MTKKIAILTVLLYIAAAAFGQDINFSKYEEIDLFNYMVEELDYGEWGRSHCYFKMALYFDRQVSTTVYFYDENDDKITMDGKQRFSLQKGQKERAGILLLRDHLVGGQM